MPTPIIDIFCHVLPPAYCDAVRRVCKPPFMFDRATSIGTMCDIDARLTLLDKFDNLRQVISLASPPIESLGHAGRVRDLAPLANDLMAEWVTKHPTRFPGFVAALPLHDTDNAVREAERACNDLGALGVQVFTSVNSQPLDSPEVLAIIEHVAKMGKAIWLHPVRAMFRADYPAEPVSKFDVWWAFGWPYETSVAMTRLVFAGFFDRFPNATVITHHCGGLVPMLEGRLDMGLDGLGTRTPPEHRAAIETTLRERPVDAFKRFHADTASFGAASSIACATHFFGANKMLFASDAPFGPNGGEDIMRRTLDAVNTLAMNETERRAILADNAINVLGLEI
jgi:aminocarboxymuconate-semialdehyde decarboxylase